MLEQLNLLEEFITCKKGKKHFKKVFNNMKRYEKYCDKLDTFYCCALDGEDLRELQIRLKL